MLEQQNKSAELEQMVVHTQNLDITLQELKNFVDANDIITDPDYQRRYVYDNKRASSLIESMWYILQKKMKAFILLLMVNNGLLPLFVTLRMNFHLQV